MPFTICSSGERIRRSEKVGSLNAEIQHQVETPKIEIEEYEKRILSLVRRIEELNSSYNDNINYLKTAHDEIADSSKDIIEINNAIHEREKIQYESKLEDLKNQLSNFEKKLEDIQPKIENPNKKQPKIENPNKKKQTMPKGPPVLKKSTKSIIYPKWS